TTAAVPGRKAPVLITREMLLGMAPGSVAVDLAAERGGNCEATQPGQTVHLNGVTLIGPTDAPSRVPHHARPRCSRSVTTFCLRLIEKGLPTVDTGDEIVRETLLTRDGQVVHPQIRERLSAPAS